MFFTGPSLAFIIFCILYSSLEAFVAAAALAFYARMLMNFLLSLLVNESTLWSGHTCPNCFPSYLHYECGSLCFSSLRHTWPCFITDPFFPLIAFEACTSLCFFQDYLFCVSHISFTLFSMILWALKMFLNFNWNSIFVLSILNLLHQDFPPSPTCSCSSASS